MSVPRKQAKVTKEKQRGGRREGREAEAAHLGDTVTPRAEGTGAPSGSPRWVQGPEDLCCPPLLSEAHELRTGLEVEQLEIKAARTCTYLGTATAAPEGFL